MSGLDLNGAPARGSEGWLAHNVTSRLVWRVLMTTPAGRGAACLLVSVATIALLRQARRLSARRARAGGET